MALEEMPAALTQLDLGPQRSEALGKVSEWSVELLTLNLSAQAIVFLELQISHC